MKTLIKNATCVLPTGEEKINVLFDGGLLKLSPPATASVDETIDATGLHLLPGVIDDQVHFREPGLTHKEDLFTASRACAKGGVTTFLEMPNTNPTTTTVERLHEKLELASSKCVVNYGFYIGATPENVEELKNAKRTPGIKIFIGSSTGNLLVDDQTALEKIFAETTLPICAHCEDESTVRANREALNGGSSFEDHSKIRDHKAALIATKRAIDLATRHQHRFHVLHVSTQEEIQPIIEGKPWITAEVCPHHLFFNIDDYERLGSRIQMNPSIKTAADNEALLNALFEGKIQVVATDHAPHTLEEKDQPYPKAPSGLPAVENYLALMLNQVNLGKWNLSGLVKAMCEAPSKVWDITNKGQIAEGYDADVVLVDMNKSSKILDEEQLTKSKWSPWHGETLQGWPVKTWVHGNLVFSDGTATDTAFGKEAQFDHSLPGFWA